MYLGPNNASLASFGPCVLIPVPHFSPIYGVGFVVAHVIVKTRQGGGRWSGCGSIYT